MSTQECVPEWSLAAIVLVCFSSLITCILSVSFYFVCHLYRNEKREKMRLLKFKKHANSMTTTLTLKSETSNTQVRAEDEYAAIPGDIGLGKRKKRSMSTHDEDDDEFLDDDMTTTMHSRTGIFKVRPSFRKGRQRSASNNSRTRHGSQQQVHGNISTDELPSSRGGGAGGSAVQRGDTDTGEYAAMDSLFKGHSNSRTNNDAMQTVPLKPSKAALPLKASSRMSTMTMSTLSAAAKKSTRKHLAGYSEELEFNKRSSANALFGAQRKRQSSRFMNSKKQFGDELLHQTQDDMIFLSLEYFDDEAGAESSQLLLPEDAELKNEDMATTTTTRSRPESAHGLSAYSSRRLTTKKDFKSHSERRVVKLYATQEIKYGDIDFSAQEFVGKGWFGRVVKARYHEIDVAVKTLHRQQLTRAELLNFKREAAIMQKVAGHKHIARMYGYCIKPQICIVTEFYERGSLRDLVNLKHGSHKQKHSHKQKQQQHPPQAQISTELRLQMSIEASLGVWHLHLHQVIHRDISARNLLVDKNWTVVVADLGMSQLKQAKSASSSRNKTDRETGPVPVKWLAPESLLCDEYSEKTDAYSFGITLFEIFAGTDPYPGLHPTEAGAKVVHEDLRPAVDSNKHIKNVPELPKLLTILWKKQAKDRPDFLYVTQSLKKIKKEWMRLVENRKVKDLYLNP